MAGKRRNAVTPFDAAINIRRDLVVENQLLETRGTSDINDDTVGPPSPGRMTGV
jgi:hypothetical protein